MGPETAILTFVADRGDERLRLDQVVLRHAGSISGISRNRVQQWITEGCVTVDHAVATRASAGVRLAAQIEVALPTGTVQRQTPEPEDMALSVLYEDEALLVVNKPAGLVVHPSYKQSRGTLLNGLLARQSRSAVPGIVTRLDKHTSGIVLVATAEGVHRIIQRDAAAGLLVKEYLALVVGSPRPRCGTIGEPLARDPADRRRMMTSSLGVAAMTHYEVLASADGRALLNCRLVTGRTHQIRCHLASRGWPIVGDAVYGSPDRLLGSRQALHAWRVSLPHPLTRQPLSVTASPPADLIAAAPTLFPLTLPQAPDPRT